MVAGQINAMANARGRLLPFSLPFRFFLAANVYQLVMWLVLLLNASQLISYHGGPGPVLSVIHLLTLGVLLMTAVGASMQLLSVATCRPMRSLLACHAISWLLIPGVAVLTYGMHDLSSLPLFTGGVMISIALLIYAALVLDNLIFSAAMGVITAYLWAAIVSLCLIVIMGIALILDYSRGFLTDHMLLALIHMLLATYGFMGMLSLGFSYILVPMFGLSTLQNEKFAYSGYFLNVTALLILLADLIIMEDVLIWSAITFGLLGSLCYLYSMHQILRQRMRKRLGSSFILIYLCWCALPLSIVCGGLLKAGFLKPAVFGVLLLLAWLFIFMIGILQRIVPFLTTMHLAENKKEKIPTPSDITSDGALMISNYGYIAALVIIFTGVLFEQVILIRIACLVGLCAGLALLYFLANIVRIKHSHDHK